MTSSAFRIFCIVVLSALSFSSCKQASSPQIGYEVSLDNAKDSLLHINMQISGFDSDTFQLKMPKWMPGYYQIMNYSDDVCNISASAGQQSIATKKTNDNTWLIVSPKKEPLTISYDIKATQQFVARSYIDTTHAYIVPANTFLYVDGALHTPTTVKINISDNWNEVATGLSPVDNQPYTYQAPDFDILYDSPLLIGALESLPSFSINGIEHRFMGYKMGEFDQKKLMGSLEKIITAATDMFQDIPYDRYTFIAIGPGRGGIEHLNNTTVTFDGNILKSPKVWNKVLSFLAHEYFHHYNVKRIRPYELGPFDYDGANRTNQLWISEGLSVYYEYMVLKEAGLVNDSTLYTFFEGNINTFEDDPGKKYQTLAEASYYTWSDGPFGNMSGSEDKSISYYEKGPVVGLLLDMAIRHATNNQKSLDDVMHDVYWEFYKKKNRGFTEAEFQTVCENIAGQPLNDIFEYVYTTKPLDYDTYLGYAGLALVNENNRYKIVETSSPTADQKQMLKSWLRN